MKTTEDHTQCNVSVNQDGQIVWKTGVIQSESCQHIFDPVVLPRDMSRAIAEAVIKAQDGSSQ